MGVQHSVRLRGLVARAVPMKVVMFMTAIHLNTCRRWPKTFRSGIVTPP
jgi:hypothetical protein